MRPSETPNASPGTDNVGMTGQSVAVALASALVLFTVVGMLASHGAVGQLGSKAVSPGAFALTVPDAERAALQPVTVTMQAPAFDETTPTVGYAITVTARQAVLLEVGADPSCPGGGGGSAVWIPPLEPGHHVMTVGLHEILVTAVER